MGRIDWRNGKGSQKKVWKTLNRNRKSDISKAVKINAVDTNCSKKHVKEFYRSEMNKVDEDNGVTFKDVENKH